MNQIYCDTAQAIILLGITGDDGVLRFPTENPDLPGLHIKADPRLPIWAQLIDKICTIFHEPYLASCVRPDDRVAIPLPCQDDIWATLYLALLTPETKLDQTVTFVDLPTMLKNMPKNKNRLAYLKVLQALSFDAELKVRILKEDGTIL